MTATTDNRAAEPTRLALVPMSDVGDSLRVDEEAGIIYGLSVISEGPAKNHGWTVDRKLITQVRDAIKASDAGVKSRFGHPTFDRDGLGTMIGRVKDARIRNGKVLADLHLSQFASRSPGGDLRSYVLSVASEDPTAAGMSIVFWPRFEELDEGGTVARLESPDDLEAVDIVDQPGANPGGMLRQPPAVRNTMSKDAENKAAEATTEVKPDPKPAENLNATPAPKAEPKGPNLEQLAAEARTAERDRVRGIMALSAEFSLGDAWAQELVDGDVSLADANTKALEKLRQQNKPVEVKVGADRTAESFGPAMSDAIRLRVAPGAVKEPHARAREFRGLSLVEMGRAYLRELGADVVGMSRTEIAELLLSRDGLARRFGPTMLYQGIGSFTDIMVDALNKTLQQTYDEKPPTWAAWAQRGTAPDFRNINRVELSEAPDLQEIGRAGEIKYVTLSDSREVYALVEYGHIIPFTRRVFINDDTGALNQVTRLQGQACTRLEDDVAYAVLTDNGNMADGNALFSAAHNNNAGTGEVGAPNVARLGTARAAIKRQRGLAGNSRLNLSANVLLVPAVLETTANQLIGSVQDPALANDTLNPFYNRLQVIAEPRLDDDSTTRWYVLHDGSQMPTVEVSFLEGEERPVFGQDIDFDTEGVKMKVRHTVAAKALAWQPMFRNDGA